MVRSVVDLREGATHSLLSNVQLTRIANGYGVQFLQLKVLLLQLLKFPRIFSFKAAVMVPPTVIRRLSDVELTQHRSNVPALGEDPVSLLDFPNDLFRRMLLLPFRHDVHSLPASSRWPEDDSHNFRT
jgi:hypothetical protein